jgi:hypothetical protein
VALDCGPGRISPDPVGQPPQLADFTLFNEANNPREWPVEGHQLTADHVVYLYNAIYREVKDLPGERIAFGTGPRRRLKSSADTKSALETH